MSVLGHKRTLKRASSRCPRYPQKRTSELGLRYVQQLRQLGDVRRDLLVSLLGLALGLVVVMHVFLCTIGSAFRHPIPFRNPRRLVKRFVSAPFHFAGR